MTAQVAREMELATSEAFVRQAGTPRQIRGQWFGERDGALIPLPLTNLWVRAPKKGRSRKGAV